MGVPKKRASRKRQANRRTKHGLEAVSVNACPSCGAAVLPHRMCAKCWTYGGQSLVKAAAVSAKAGINKK